MTRIKIKMVQIGRCDYCKKFGKRFDWNLNTGTKRRLCYDCVGKEVATEMGTIEDIKYANVQI